MQVHQHVQPFGAFHAQCPRHTGLLRRCLPQRPCAVAHTARRPGVIDDAFILFRRVSVPHAVGLPQRHAVASCLCHCLAPAAVPLHKLVLRLSGLVHGVFQLVQLRVLVPQLRIAVGRPVLDLARQRFGQRFGLVHVRSVGLQVVHQHFGLLRQLRPVGLAAVGLQPAPGQLVHRAAAHIHAPCQPKELAQRVQRRRLLRDHPACLLLLVPLRVPLRLLGQLITELCKFAFLCQLPGPVIFPDLAHHFVRVHTPAVRFACRHTSVRCGNVQNELPAFPAQFVHHLPDLFHLLCGRFRVCRKVDARSLCHHAHVSVQQKLVQRFRAGLYFCRAEHFPDRPMVRVPCPLTLRKVQHLAVRQNVPCLFKVLGHAEPLFCQLPAVLCFPAVFFRFRIIGQLPVVRLCVRPCLQPFSCFSHPVAQCRTLFFQLCQTAVVVLALCNVTLVFLALAVRLCFCRKIPQRFLLRFNSFHFCAFQPCRALFLQRFLLFAQRLLLGAQLFHLVRFCDLHPHIFLYRCVILCYSSIRRYFLDIRKVVQHRPRELCGSIFFFCYRSVLVHQNVASIRPAHLVHIERFSSIMQISAYNNTFVKFRSVHFNRSCKDICIKALPKPVFFISNLFTFGNYFRHSRKCCLFCPAVSVPNRIVCLAPIHLNGSKAFSFRFVSNRIEVFFCIIDIFADAISERNLISTNKGNNVHFFQLIQMFVHLLGKRIFSFVQLKPLFLRRSLVLKGRGVFFCRAQIFHCLLRVGKVFLLQCPLLCFRQPLRFQGSPVLRVFRQHFLCAAHDVAQKVLHRVHHFADGPGPAGVLFGLPALELHPPFKAFLAVKDAAPRIGHQLFRCFPVGQVLLCVISQFRPDQLVDVLKAFALRQIFQHMLLQRLRALGVQCVVPVPVLVQHGAEHVARAVRKKDLPGRRVHIGPHPLISFQHSLQHCICVGRPRVQLDQLRGHFVRRAHGPLVQHPSAAACALLTQHTARCPGLQCPGFRFALALQPRHLQRRFAAGLRQHILGVHGKAVHALCQLHGLVKGGHVLHLSQPVKARCCRRIPAFVRNSRRHIPAQRLRRAIAHLPALQLFLYAALLRALAAHFQSGCLPHGCRFRLLHGLAFHHFPDVFHGLLLCCLRLRGLPFRLCPRRHLRVQHLRLHSPVRVPCGHHAVPDLAPRALLLSGLLLLHGVLRLLFCLRLCLRCAPLGFHLPQQLPGLCRRAGQLHAVLFRKGRAVRFVGRVRGKQLDGPARQLPAVHGLGQLLHRRVAALHRRLLCRSFICRRCRLLLQHCRIFRLLRRIPRLPVICRQGFPLGDRLPPVICRRLLFRRLQGSLPE